MKIIGSATNTVLLAVTKSEFKVITGLDYDESVRAFGVSLFEMELNVTAVAKKHAEIRDVLNTPEYSNARIRLEKMLNSLSEIEPLVSNLNDKINNK